MKVLGRTGNAQPYIQARDPRPRGSGEAGISFCHVLRPFVWRNAISDFARYKVPTTDECGMNMRLAI